MCAGGGVGSGGGGWGWGGGILKRKLRAGALPEGRRIPTRRPDSWQFVSARSHEKATSEPTKPGTLESDIGGILSSQPSWKRGPSLAHEGKTTESLSKQ